ncbi:MAG: hypothetical protein WCR46_15485 [Deltaproteobacteria bacterium]|jgi:hypothetical protein
MLIKQQDNYSSKKGRKGNFYSLTLSKICLDFGVNLNQDEAGKLDREAIAAIFDGAADVDVRIIRVPRENVRSSHILKLVTLRDKILEMARLKSELVPDSVLAKADFLETMTPEQVMSAALAGGTLCG